MQEIQLFCDSTGGFSAEELDALQVTLLPLTVHWDGGSLTETTRESFAAYYQTLKTLVRLPTTSQPAIGFIAEHFKRAVEEGRKVITVTLSPGLSGTYQNACAAADMAGKKHISVINSMSCTAGVKFLARIARRLIDEGKSYEEVVRSLREAGRRNGAIMAVDDMKYLKMGGRLQSAQYLMGKMLGVRPVLKMKDGFLVPHKTVRGMKQAIASMIEAIPDKLSFLTVLHCDNLRDAEECADRLGVKYRGVKVGVEDLSPVIGTHLGNGSVGIVYCASF